MNFFCLFGNLLLFCYNYFTRREKSLQNKLVIIYDYDGTLAPGSIQEPKLIPLLMPEYKDNPQLFWNLPNQRAKSGDLDGNLMYMNVLIEKAKERNIPLTRSMLKECGSYSENFPGVTGWFSRINNYGQSKGVVVEHYIISSGNEELLIGTKIAKFFTGISACKFYFNDEGIATEAGTTLNDHTKTKFIENIRTFKDADDPDLEAEKLPYANMVYIGDGFTDMPAMKMILNSGGLSFAVYSNEKTEKMANGFKEKNFVNACYHTATCYTPNSPLEKTIFKEIERISRSSSSDKPQQMSIFDYL